MERNIDLQRYLLNNRIILVISGPTASGKTKISLELTNDLNIEIISADSRQIFKYINIGTAKPTIEELSIVPHHFIDCLELDEYYSAGMFEKDAEEIISEIFNRGRIPVITGGTGLYIKALCEGIFDDDKNEENSNIRNDLQEILEKEGKEVLYDKLVEIDPVAAQKYDDKNPRRVMRALEYYYSKGKKLSDAHIQSIKEKEFKIIYFGVQKPREILYDLINERVLNMWEAGLENETKNILEMGYPETLNSLQTVGYKETLSYIKGNITKEEAIYLIQRNTRRYAKRQMTWFRSLENIIWIENREDIIKYLKQIVSRETLKDE
ncbi:MAG TPA: tRNA (adenosine(37)-N6)-dimethylallyltransferase MiaA [Candidatus Kapabacteria bacterium]|nr:tRNA (adenosine(37)-N6)-dimethylallyltransferase MiaA [Candidatus Kapabacteria bacterium]HPO62681.1 tRNA (adenosine(37)-N6)-dimethylallyltransferase MiaA [Candidatus Kapabacteria bacterium]